jgi:hypothetical protein
LCSLLVARVSISAIFGTKRGADRLFPRLRLPFLYLDAGVFDVDVNEDEEGVEACAAAGAGAAEDVVFAPVVDCVDVLIFGYA